MVSDILPAVAAPSGVAPAVSTSAKAPLTVLIPTLNEAKNLPRCLDHLTWADEILVVDSCSTDETAQIAEAYGAKVVPFKWNGQWPKKRNWALRNVRMKHEWILIVDADEWIVPELAREIAEAIKSPDKIGYYINRRFIFMGRWIKHCGYYPSWNLRLIKHGFGEYEKLTDIGDTGSGDNEVHEHIVPHGEVGYLKHDMLHLAFPNINTFVEKHNRYSNWEAAVQLAGTHLKRGEVAGNETLSRRRRLKNASRHLPFRSLLRFLYSYILKRGFLDGRAGYIFCRLLATYEFLSVAKFKEMRQAEEDAQKLRRLSDVPERDWRKMSSEPSR